MASTRKIAQKAVSKMISEAKKTGEAQQSKVWYEPKSQAKRFVTIGQNTNETWWIAYDGTDPLQTFSHAEDSLSIGDVFGKAVSFLQ